MFWLWFGGYLVGALLTLRVATLKLRDKYERKVAGRNYGLRPSWANYVWAMIPMVLFWPVLTVALGAWKLIFPRGVKTRYTKEQELQAALLKAEQEAKVRDLQVKNLEEQIRAWEPRTQSQEEKAQS